MLYLNTENYRQHKKYLHCKLYEGTLQPCISSDVGAMKIDFNLPIDEFAQQYGMYVLFYALEGELLSAYNKQQKQSLFELKYSYEIGIVRYLKYFQSVQRLNMEMKATIVAPRIVNIFNQKYKYPIINETDTHRNLATYATIKGKIDELPYTLDKKFLYLFDENILQKYKKLCKYIW